MKHSVLVLCLLLAAGCASTRYPQPHGVSLVTTRGHAVDLDSIVNRKARKYGVNPNLIHAVVHAELARSGRKHIDDRGIEWIVEQVAKVLHHVLRKTSSISLAIDYYATGTFKLSQDIDEETRRFASAVVSDFRRREKTNRWHGWR